MIVRAGVEANTVASASGLQPYRVPQPRIAGRSSCHLLVPLPRADFRVHDNSLNNLIRTLENRVMSYKGTEIDQNLPDVEACRQLRATMNKLVLHPVTKLSTPQFLNCYTGRRRMWYEKAAISLETAPINVDVLKKDARVRTFIKAEKFNFLDKGRDADPRAIQPRDPRFLLEAGRYLKPMEKHIYRALDALYGEPTIAKGYNAEQTGEILARKWNSFKEPVALSLDASRFDLHVTQRHLKLCHDVYLRCNPDPLFKRLLKATLTNNGLATCRDHGVKYQVQGRRMSGDMDTALGNCLLMTVITYTVFRSLVTRHSCLDNGDDVLVIIEKDELHKLDPKKIEESYWHFGFRVKLEKPVHILERIEFCQTQPINRGDQYVMIRKITSLAKDVTMLGDPGRFPTWIHGIGECGLSLTDGIPIGPAFYKMLLRLGTRSKRINRDVMWQSGMANLATGMRSKGREVSVAARLSFYVAFGITPVMQRAIEAHYDSVMDPRGFIKKQQAWQLNDECSREGNEWFHDVLTVAHG